MNTEDLIREALQRQADRAPAPGRVLASLHRPPRRRRALVLVAAAVVGVLIVAGGAFALRQNLAEPPPPAAPPFPVGYAPGWLPDGYSEQARNYHPDGSVSRTWMGEPLTPELDPSAWAGPWVAMTYWRYRDDLVPDDVVGGLTGELSVNEENGSTAFTWLPDPAGRAAVSVIVDRMPDDQAVLEQVVRSVRADPVTSPVPLLVGSGWHAVLGTPDDWRVEVSDGQWEGLSFTAALGSQRPFLKGEPTVVRGMRAVVGGYGVAVQLAPDRWFSVRPNSDRSGAIPADRLIAIANSARIDLYPDMSWLGRR